VTDQKDFPRNWNIANLFCSYLCWVNKKCKKNLFILFYFRFLAIRLWCSLLFAKINYFQQVFIL